jgi:hypothetical protein
MRQWKVALSLAIVGAIAAPFVFDTYNADPTSHTWVPIRAEDRAAISARLNETNNCQVLTDRVNSLPLPKDPEVRTSALLQNNDFLPEVDCHIDQDRLQNGGYFETHPDLLKYLAINGLTAGAIFGAIFGLAFLVPTLVRRYWRWLNA